MCVLFTVLQGGDIKSVLRHKKVISHTSMSPSLSVAAAFTLLFAFNLLAYQYTPDIVLQ